ncbi:hypothetical protein EAF00_008978 [Botryotinia globosa]|nr:hypothetical protein EAF00_008978 [Botryotinia globosa]
MEEEPGSVLVRDMHASIQLSLQHYLWKDGLGYLLDPSIPPPPPGSKYRIADLGTGAGYAISNSELCYIWPGDSLQLCGFDISSAQFPHPNYLPSNVRLEVVDSLQVDPPEELLESFDIVHLRLWLGVVMNGDPSAVLTHALKLLRPGGYIQWDEVDPNRGIAEGPNGEEAPHIAKVLNVQANIKHHSYIVASVLSHCSFRFLNSDTHRWIPALPKLFARYDLEDIKEDFAFEQPWQTKMMGDGSSAVVHEMANNGSRFVMEKLESVGVDVPMAYEEVCRGARPTQPFCVTFGRKPIKMSV